MLNRQQRLLGVLQEDGPALHLLLTRLTRRSDAAEDLLQDLFVNLARSDGFLRCQNPSAYARQAAMHLAFNWRRSQVRHKTQDRPLDDPVTREPPPLARMVRFEQIQRVLDALAELPEPSRELLVMRFMEGQSYEAIARHAGGTVHHARALCHKGLRRLRELLGKEAQRVAR